MTMGQWTIVLNLLFMLLELPFMTREDLKTDRRIFLLQIPVTLFFGAFIDCSMEALCWLAPQTYPAKIFSLLVGCVVLLSASPSKSRSMSPWPPVSTSCGPSPPGSGAEFGYVKLGFDITLVLLACALSLGFMSGIYGVREGRSLRRLIVGPIVHFVTPFYRFLDGWIGEPGPHSRPEPEAGCHVVITIAREFGSGGHLLGERLARRLGLPLYDREFIRLAAQQSGMDERYILQNERSIPSFWLTCSSPRRTARAWIAA